MAANDSHDEKIELQGLYNYNVEPPLDIFSVTET